MIRSNSLVRHTFFHCLFISTLLTGCRSEDDSNGNIICTDLNDVDFVYNDPYRLYLREDRESEFIFNMSSVSNTTDHYPDFKTSPQVGNNTVGAADNGTELPNAELTW